MKDKVKVHEDPEVVAFKWANTTKSGKAIVSNPIQLGVLGKAEGYNAQSINEGLANSELISFVNISKRDDKTSVLEVIRKRGGSQAQGTVA